MLRKILIQRAVLCFLLVSFGLAACGGKGADFGVPVLGGIEYRGKVSVDGRQHEYYLYVPAQDVLDDNVPLIINLHGGGSNRLEHESFSRLRLDAARDGYAVLSPEGYRQTWNAGACCAPASDEDIDHVTVIRRMIDEVANTIDLDAGRVYATGHSNGGMMAYRLACEASDVIAAIAPVSAFQMDKDVNNNATEYLCNPLREVPVLHIHGLSDNCAPFNGGNSGGPEGGTRPPVEEGIEFWRSENRCALASTTATYGSDARCQVWSRCGAGSEVQLCTIDSGGHIWPGTDENPLRSTCGGQGSEAIDANTAMWAFFRRFRL
ncbi:MAG: extracellular catalytic domain type 1 short-chain-length polyhydroxyalkanoate depolymerase [Oceanococcus sp.]